MKIYLKIILIFLISFFFSVILIVLSFAGSESVKGNNILNPMKSEYMQKMISSSLDLKSDGERAEFLNQISEEGMIEIKEVYSEGKPEEAMGKKVFESGTNPGRFYIFTPKVPSKFLPVILLAGILVPAAVIFVIFSTLRPLSQLAGIMHEFGRGNLNAKADIRTGDHDLKLLIGNFNSMAERIKAMHDRDKILLASIPHELRTPVSSLRWGFEIIKETKNYERLDELDSLIGILEKTLSDIDLITSSISDDTEADLSEFSLKEFMEEFSEEIKAFLSSRNKTLELITSERSFEFFSVKGNPAYLSVILKNLVKNSAEYEKNENAVRIILSGERNIRILVSAELAPDIKTEELFIPFYRGRESRIKNPAGKGIGLTVAKSLAEKMNWRLFYEKGYFVIECPWGKPESVI